MRSRSKSAWNTVGYSTLIQLRSKPCGPDEREILESETEEVVGGLSNRADADEVNYTFERTSL